MMELKTLIKENLHIPVVETSRPILPPCATWYLVLDRPGLLGNGYEEEVEEQYQADIWGRDRGQVTELSSKLKWAIMQDRNATVPTISYSYDTNGKIWRGSISFYYIKEA